MARVLRKSLKIVPIKHGDLSEFWQISVKDWLFFGQVDGNSFGSLF
jgi:hypothetical protein